MMDDQTAPAAAFAGARPSEALCTLLELEVRHIARALELARGNQRRAARMLGITRWALARRLRKHGLGRRCPASN